MEERLRGGYDGVRAWSTGIRGEFDDVAQFGCTFSFSLRVPQVWVSEIMLQQTQVKTVIDYWNRWMVAFPDVRSLAKADIEEVNSIWSGQSCLECTGSQR